MGLPSLPSLPGGAGKKAVPLDRASLAIAGKRFDFWTEVEIEQWIDRYSTVSFSTPFQPEQKEFRQIFKPFSYQPVQAFAGSQKLFTGTLIDVDPEADQNSSTVKVSCYAKPAVLHDCEPSWKDVDTREFNEMDIVQIANAIGKAFGFTASVDKNSILRDGSTIDAEFIKRAVVRGKRGGIKGGKGSKFARLALSPGDNPQEFLAGLAKQRGVVIVDDADGNLLFQNSVDVGSPVAVFEEGKQPVISVKANFNAQDYFSEITAFTPTKKNRKGAKYTQPNPLLSGVVRPTSFKPDDTDKSEAPDAAAARMGRMFGNVVSWDIVVPTWLDPQGALLRPNTTIVVKAPRAMIYSPSELLVRSVKLKQSKESTTAELNLVLPGAFSGQFPASFPWDEPPATGLAAAAGLIESLASKVGL